VAKTGVKKPKIVHACAPLFLERLAKSVEQGKTQDAISLIEHGLGEGYSAHEMLNDGLIRGMSDIGVRFKIQDVFIPDVLIAARTLKKCTDVLKPTMIDEGVKPVGTAVVATVAGDLHDIGKNLVCMMFEGAGFHVIDLGVDVTAEAICEAVKAHKPDILALSALLNTTLNQLMAAINFLEKSGVRDQVIVMVGGAPVDESFAKKIGADAYSKDAVTAAEVAKNFLTEEQQVS
jgi:5-methyltetrahydrofolate--homocysteine methyltransferase